MRRHTQIQWARQSTGSRQDPNDGSRLINCYAVNPAALRTAPQQPVTQVEVRPVESASTVFSLPDDLNFDRAGITVETNRAINGIVLINSPVYGKRLLGVLGGYWFYQIVLGGTADDDPPAGPVDPSEKYIVLSEANPAEGERRIFQYTTEAENSAGANPVKLATDGRRVLFTAHREVYAFDCAAMDAGKFQTILAPTPDDQSAELPDEAWVDVVWVDGYFVLFARGGQIFHSNHNSLRFDQLDFASAESNPDAIVGALVFRRRIYVFGRASIEVWYNAGDRDFAFRRDNSYTMNIGCVSRNSLQQDVDRMYFIGSDGIVYATGGSAPQRISHEAVESDIKRYANGVYCRTAAYTSVGHRFYTLELYSDEEDMADREALPSAVWGYDATTGFWHERDPNAALEVNGQVEIDGRTLLARAKGSSEIDVLSSFRWRPSDDDTIVQLISPTLIGNTAMTRVFNLRLHTSFDASIHKPGNATLQISRDGGNTWLPSLGFTRPLAPSMDFPRLGSDIDGLGFNFRLTYPANVVSYPSESVRILGAYIVASAGLS